MKKTIKRLVSLTLAAILSVSVLSACAPAPTLMEFLEPETTALNLNGWECILGMYAHSDNTGLIVDLENPFGYKGNTDLADAVLSRIKNVESTLNCDIVLTPIKTEETLLMTQFLAGNIGYHILYSSSHALTKKAARAGFLEKVNNYGHVIDFTNTEKYGSAAIQELNAVNGDIYAVAPLTWIYKQPRAVELLIFNDDLMWQYATPNPAEYIENGNWNWDAFENIIANSSYHSEDKDIYSIAARGLDIAKLLAYGNGVRFAYKTENGYEYDYGSENMMEAVNFYYKLKKEYPNNFAFKEGDWVDVLENFATIQNSVSCLTTAQMLYDEISFEVKNYSVYPFPTGPKGEYGSWPSAVEGPETFSVFDAPEACFEIVDKICEPLDGYETEESRFDYMTTQVFYDINDAKYALNTYKNGMYTYWAFEDSAGNGFDKLWRGFEDGAELKPKSATVVLDELKDIYAGLIEEFVVPNLPIYDLIPE